MSDQTPYPPLPNYDASRNGGVMYVDELGPDGTLFQLKLYPVPAEALSLVEPTQVVGISSRELQDAPPDAQCLVLETWFRLNHQPAAPHVYAQYKENFFSPQIILGNCFTAQELDGLHDGLSRLWPKLAAEARIWVQKPPEPRDARRESALRALDELEAVTRQGQSGIPGLGHNSRSKLFDEGVATLNDSSREALAAVEESRQELLAEPPNFGVLRRSAQTLIKLARMAAAAVGRMASATWSVVREPVKRAIGHVVKDAYDNGLDVAIAHLSALAHKAREAAMALQHFLGGS